MSAPDRPHHQASSRWRRLSWSLDIRDRWRVFCDEHARRLNAAGPAGSVPPPPSVTLRRSDEPAGTAGTAAAVSH